MSVLGRLGVRSSIASFIEMVVFFCILTPAYFLPVAWAYTVAAGKMSYAWSAGVHGALPTIIALLGFLAGTLPIWMWLLLGIGYIMFVTLYWSPGEEETNKAEVRGLVLFMLVAVITLGFWSELRYGALSSLWSTFRQVLNL